MNLAASSIVRATRWYASWFAVAVVLAQWFGGGSASAQAPAAGKPARLYDQEPYDLVTLDDASRTKVKTYPLKLPNRRLPKVKAGKLTMLLFEDPNEPPIEDPDDPREVPWDKIIEVKFFEQMLLDEASRLVAAGKFNDAFDYYDFLRVEYPKFDGVSEAISEFLSAEAQHWQRLKQYENALALYMTLYERQPDRPGLESAMGDATGKLIEQYLEQKDYRSVRRLTRELRSRFPNSTSAARFEQQLESQAAQLVGEARRQVAASNPRQALTLARQALLVWPKAANAKETAQQAFNAFPVVNVGVTSLAVDGADPLSDWATRRTRRLVQRQIFEFIGYGANGGEYAFPFGQYQVVDLGRTLAMQVAPDIRWSPTDILTGYDVARRLLSFARQGTAEYRPDWAENCASVEVRDVYNVNARFAAAHLLPMALLTVPLVAADSPALQDPSRPYQRNETSAEESTYTVQSDYFARQPTMPQGIVERLYPSRSAALEGLRQGEISILDRLAAWEIADLKGEDSIVVAPYCVPTIHCLVPNLSRPAPKNRSFRRALLYGVDRKFILNEHLLRKQEVSGCQLTSGPFPKGTSLSDPLGYAYHDEIAPRPYEPPLAMSLVAVALHDLSVASVGAGGKPLKEMPTIVLAHPADEVARGACKAIQKNLALIGLKIELREFAAGQSPRATDDYDLLYLEYTLDEPLVQVRRLFGEDGLIGPASSYMSVALRQLDSATRWNEARRALNEVHRIAHEDVSLIPLWQLTEFYAYRSSLSGMAAQNATLYQQVEQWQAAAPLPVEER